MSIGADKGGNNTNQVIPDECCGHQPVDLYIRTCIFQNAQLTFGNQQSSRPPLCDRFINVLNSFDTKIGVYREWVNRRGIAMENCFACSIISHVGGL